MGHESREISGTGHPTPQVEPARKILLLMDATVADMGRLVTFKDVSEAVAGRGVKLSRARWFYMKDATGPVVRDRPLLTALSEYFNVNPGYLLGAGGAQTPALVSSRMDFIRAMRACRVQMFAARELGELLPETLRGISEILARDMALSARGAAAGRLGPKQHLPPSLARDG